VDPKEVDFRAVGIKVKMKIAPAAIQAFQKKVPVVPGKPFDVFIDWDQNIGKCRITVKKLGSDWDFEWEDETFKANKKKLEGVSLVLNKWDGELTTFRTQTAAKELGDLKVVVDGLEKRAASKDVRSGLDPRLLEAARAKVRTLGTQSAETRAKCQQWWNGGPQLGIGGIMKKLGIPDETINSAERSSSDSFYAYLQQSFKQCLDACATVDKEAPGLLKRLDALMVTMNANHAAAEGAHKQIAEAAKALQATLKQVQGFAAADFAELKYDETVKAAAEFKKKSGNAYTILSRNPDTMQQVVERNGQRMEKSRLLSGRFESACSQWNKIPDFISRDPDVRKGLESLGAIRKEYFEKLGTYQNSLKSFDETLKETLAKLAKAKGKTA
jgi:hypothetical protein